MPITKAPNYDPNYQVYAYPGGALKRKEGKKAFWDGLKGTVPKMPYNPMAINLARDLKRTLWICESEQDTEVMLEAGELAIGIPPDSRDFILSNIHLKNFQGLSEVIIVFGHDEPGRKGIERTLETLPFAWTVDWPEDTPDGFDVTDLRKVEPENFPSVLREWVSDRYPFEPLIKHIADKFDKDLARNPDRSLGYGLSKFENLERNIDGIQPGFYVIAADANVAKGAFLCNLTLDLLATNKDLTGIFFSMDDSRDVILNHFLSIKTGIPLNQVQRPQRLAKHKKVLMEGYDYLSELALENRMFIMDSSEIKNVDELILEMKRRMNFKLFVAIDALCNLGIDQTGDIQGQINADKINRLKALANIYQIPISCTAELSSSKERIKMNNAPTIHDLMESEKFAYNASLVLMLYPKSWNDYHKENEALLNLKYEKNQLSYFRGTDLLKFRRSTNQIEEYNGKLV
ncbi:MAG: DnaB-like helicase C-terminal domain-containing protein [Pseudomonadota bacterium]